MTKARELRSNMAFNIVGAIVALFLTQDFSGSMAFFDIWSILFGVIAIIQIAIAAGSKKTKDDGDETGAPYASQMPPTVNA